MGGTYHADNIRMINEKSHRNFHMVFSNKTPVAQIRQLTQFNSSALNNEVRLKLLELLEPYTWPDEIYAYKNGVLVPRKFIEAMLDNHH